MAFVPINGVNIVLTGENEPLNRAAAVRGGYEEVHLLFDPKYLDPPSLEGLGVDIKGYFNFHKVPIDYNNQTEVRREVVKIAKPYERVRMKIVCEDNFGYGYAIAGIAALEAAKLIELSGRNIEVSLPRLEGGHLEEQFVHPFSFCVPKISLGALRVLGDIEDETVVLGKREIPFSTLLQKHDLIYFKKVSENKHKVKLTEMGSLIKELV